MDGFSGQAPAFDNPLLKFKEGLAAPAAKASHSLRHQEGRGRRPPRPGATAAGAGVAAPSREEAAREAGENAASLDFEALISQGFDAATTPSPPCKRRLGHCAISVVPLV